MMNKGSGTVLQLVLPCLATDCYQLLRSVRGPLSNWTRHHQLRLFKYDIYIQITFHRFSIVLSRLIVLTARAYFTTRLGRVFVYRETGLWLSIPDGWREECLTRYYFASTS